MSAFTVSEYLSRNEQRFLRNSLKGVRLRAGMDLTFFIGTLKVHMTLVNRRQQCLVAVQDTPYDRPYRLLVPLATVRVSRGLYEIATKQTD